MSRIERLALLAAVFVCAFVLGQKAEAGQFGRNKVEYVDFDFKVLDTEHFAIYYYSSEETAARLAGRLAERWYARLSHLLGHSIQTRQPLILYASQPEFAQTNVVPNFLGDGIGGVTEAARRRIVMPFAPTLAETDQILGHEIVHAFQFDITRRRGGVLAWPLWAVEGMAQYLSLGAEDDGAAVWLRDAVEFDLLPERYRKAAGEFSPYRFGSAMWAYIAGRFGDRVIGEVLKAARGGTLERRLEKATGVKFDQLYADWRALSYEHYRTDPQRDHAKHSPLLRGSKAGKLHLGPSLSPDGTEAVFFSEKDRLSLDLYLANTESGGIKRRLATTVATARLENLQAVRSAGAWSASGDRFAYGVVSSGRAELVLLDMRAKARGDRERHVAIPQVGQIFTPSWSPDGRSIAFSALTAGVTDLFIYGLDTGTMRQITDDAYADLHPAWSPDGRAIAFVSDRFSTDLDALRFGRCELAIVDLASSTIRRVPAIDGAKQVNPQWSEDGASVFFVSDPGGINNVYRLEIASGRIFQITHASGGVAGLTPTSPALSVARSAPVIAFTVYRKGTYELQIERGSAAVTGESIAERTARQLPALPPAERLDGAVTAILDDSQTGLPPRDDSKPPRPYPSSFFLESVGQPYLSSGGGPFGTFVRGGGSLLFSDVLGERKLSMAAQAGNHLRDLGLSVQFLNRERRWNWGAVAELQPSIRRLPRQRLIEHEGEAALSRETYYFERMQLRTAALFAYPFNQAQRIEFQGGIRHITYRQTVQSTVRSLETARVLDQEMTTGSGGLPVSVAEAGAAFVTDTSVFGATGPIVGARSRYEASSTLGGLSFFRVLLDQRHYSMPVKPYTIATRIMHMGQYGRDANDPRLLPTFLGSRQFVHGYGWSSLRCSPAADGSCAALEELLGSRLVVGNFEVRAPLMGVMSGDIRYGRVPADVFIFADSGLVWSGSLPFASNDRDRRLVSSFGGGIRVNAFGIPIEMAAVRALNAPARGWSFDFSVRPGF